MNYKFNLLMTLLITMSFMSCEKSSTEEAIEVDDSRTMLTTVRSFGIKGPNPPADACASAVAEIDTGGPLYISSCCEVHIHECEDSENTDIKSFTFDACLGGPEYTGKSYRIMVQVSLDGEPFEFTDYSACRNVEGEYCTLNEPYKVTVIDDDGTVNEEIVCLGNDIIGDGETHTWCFKSWVRVFSKPDCGGSFQDIVPCGHTTLCYEQN